MMDSHANMYIPIAVNLMFVKWNFLKVFELLLTVVAFQMVYFYNCGVPSNTFLF